MPIAILEISKDSETQVSKDLSRQLCEAAADSLHKNLRVPDPKDKEIRVLRSDSNETTLTISFTVGPNEYPDFEPSSFLPTKEQMTHAGQKIKELVRDSPIEVSRITIESWKDTTFLLRENDVPEPIAPVSEEELREAGGCMHNPRIRLSISPLTFQEGFPSKEGDRPRESENFQNAASEISTRLTEMFGLSKSAISQELVFPSMADTNVSVEFDCETDPGNPVSEKIRRFMAESVVAVLNKNISTKDGSGEVWIRQGQPDKEVIYL